MKKQLIPKVKRSVKEIKAYRINCDHPVHKRIDRNKQCISIEHIATIMGHASLQTALRHLRSRLKNS